MNVRKRLAANIMANVSLTGGIANMLLAAQHSRGTLAIVAFIASVTSIAAAAGLGILAKEPR